MGEFTLRLLHYLAEEDLADCVFYFTRPDGSVSIQVNCSDLFWWATADGEEVTAENFPILAQSIDDCKSVDDFEWASGLDLFACRVRKMRPQDCAYPDNKLLWPLFDAAGPEREIDNKPFGNPFPREAYWQKRQQRKKTELEEARQRIVTLEAQLKEIQCVQS